MSRSYCKWVEARIDDYQRKRLVQEEISAVEMHLTLCDQCREMAGVWAGLAVAVRQAPLRPWKRGIATPGSASAMQELLLSQNRQGELGMRRAARRIAISAVVAVSAVAAAVLLVMGPTLSRGPSHSPVTLESPQTGRALLAQARPLALPAPMLHWSAGARFGAISVDRGTALWTAPSSAVGVGHCDASGVVFHVDRGFVLAEVGPQPPGFRFVIETPSRDFEARGTVFSVAVDDDGEARARVAEGIVEVREHGSQLVVQTLFAGEGLAPRGREPERLTLAQTAEDLLVLQSIEDAPTLPKPESASSRQGGSGEPKATHYRKALAAIQEGRLEEAAALADSQAASEPRAERTLEVLVELAQAYRRSRNFEAAVAAYHRLIDSFPNSQTARNSLVPLGQLELSAMSDPTNAAAHFDEYLRQSNDGTLAEEARVGKVRAAVRSGNADLVIRTTSDYLESHGQGTYVGEMLRRRGEALSRQGDCAGASADFQKVIEDWPRSKESDRAKVGLEACQRDR